MIEVGPELAAVIPHIITSVVFVSFWTLIIWWVWP